MSGGNSELRDIQHAINEARGGEAATSFAHRIRLAPATLQEFATGSSASFKGWANGKSGKALAGRAESLGRLFGFLRDQERAIPVGDENAFVALFGLDDRDVNVQQGLERWRRADRPTDTFLTHNDPTLDRIVAGDGKGREPGELRAGILVWSPYCKDGSNPKISFAGRMMNRLLGSLNPLGWQPPEHRALKFNEILSPDILKRGEVDAIFSLYDLPSRRVAGFDFIRVPGLAAPLGAITFSHGHNDGLVISWRYILDPERNGGLKVYVVSRDAGEILFRGACAYPSERIETIKIEGDAAQIRENIVDALVRGAKEYAVARALHKKSRSTPPAAPFVFVADAAMVEEIAGAFLQRRETSEPDLPVTEFIPENDPWCPTYPIGIAVSANSERWRSILQDALIRELFVNSGALTAREYAILLAEPSTIRVSYLGDEIPSETKKRFIDDVITALQNLQTLDIESNESEDLKTDRRKNSKIRIEEIKERWLTSSPQTSDSNSPRAR